MVRIEKKKKVLIITFSLLLLIGLVFLLNKSLKKPLIGVKALPDTAQTKTLKVGYGYDPTVSWKTGESPINNDWTRLYEESGYHLETLFDVDEKDYDKKMTIAIESGNYPDVFQVDGTELVRYANAGIISDITEEYEKYASPKLREYMEIENGRYLDSAKIKGKLYGLPKINWKWSSSMMLFIRQDWLDNLGLSEPTTIEELKEVALAFSQNDPDGNGKDDTYGLVLNGKENFSVWSGIQAFFECYGLAPGHWSGNFPFTEKDGAIEWGGMNSELMKKALTDLNEMYTSGGLVDNFPILDNESILTELSSGRAGMFFAPAWGAMSLQVDSLENNPDAKFIAYRLPDGNGYGSAKPYINDTPTHFSVISSQYESPEELIKLANIAVDKLINPVNEKDLRYDAGFADVNELEVGIGWKGSLTQFRKITNDYDNDKVILGLLAGKTIPTNGVQSSIYEDMQAYKMAEEEGNVVKEINQNNPSVIEGIKNWTMYGNEGGMRIQHDIYYRYRIANLQKYVTTPTETMANKYIILNPLTQETLIRIIVGENDIASYDTFLENWWQMGGEAITKEANDWYKQTEFK